MRHLRRAVHAGVFGLLTSAALSASAVPPAAQRSDAPASVAPRAEVPFVVGLTTVGATQERRGDYETLHVVEAIDAGGYRLRFSGEVPADHGGAVADLRVERRVRDVDRRTSHRMRNYFHSSDPQQFTGTVPGFSVEMVEALRRSGRTAFTWLEVASFFGMTTVKQEHTGTLVRDARAPATRTVLVNGRRTALPILRAAGTMDTGGAFAFDVLDDPRNPIVLSARGPGFSTSVVRIEFPEPAASARTLERALATTRKADVYGIHFAFASATLRPESDAVLARIAAALKAHPDWTLRIDGHTDGIGGAAANLALSRRRAEAVKAALVQRHAIAAARLATGGFGDTRPKADNATAEGRAANRRVELTRP